MQGNIDVLDCLRCSSVLNALETPRFARSSREFKVGPFYFFKTWLAWPTGRNFLRQETWLRLQSAKKRNGLLYCVNTCIYIYIYIFDIHHNPNYCAKNLHNWNTASFFASKILTFRSGDEAKLASAKAKNRLQLRRSVARNAGSTYAPDFLGTLVKGGGFWRIFVVVTGGGHVWVGSMCISILYMYQMLFCMLTWQYCIPTQWYS